MNPNCVTLDATLQVLRCGYQTFTAGAGETYHTSVGALIPALALRYHKIVGGVLTEMTQGEKDVVDALPDEDLHVLQYPSGEVEELIVDGAVSVLSYATKITINNLNLTLADGLTTYQAKLIQSQGGSCTVTCSLPSPYVSFTLANSGKVQLMWHHHAQWITIDSKNVTYNV